MGGALGPLWVLFGDLDRLWRIPESTLSAGEEVLGGSWSQGERSEAGWECEGGWLEERRIYELLGHMQISANQCKSELDLYGNLHANHCKS